MPDLPVPVAGMTFGPDGLLYVAQDFVVTRYDPKTGNFLDSFAFLEPQWYLDLWNTPHFGPNGDFYAVAYSYGSPPGVDIRKVERFNGRTGARMAALVSSPDYFALSEFGFLGSSVAPPDGYLFTVDDGGVTTRDPHTGAPFNSGVGISPYCIFPYLSGWSPAGSNVTGIGGSQTGDVVFVGTGNGTIHSRAINADGTCSAPLGSWDGLQTCGGTITRGGSTYTDMLGFPRIEFAQQPSWSGPLIYAVGKRWAGCDENSGNYFSIGVLNPYTNHGKEITLGDSIALQPPVSCDDGNPCTQDDCAPFAPNYRDTVTGCTHTPLTGPSCDDGNGCTQNTTCQNGTCGGGVQVTCDDGLSCTTDRCQSTGTNTHTCSNTPMAGTCLIGGVCYNDGDVNPANSCQSCDSATSQTAFSIKSDGTACDDHNACTVGDTCQKGACTSGPLTDCSDQKPCTVDSCDPGTGCQHIDLGSNCRRDEGFIGGGWHDCPNYDPNAKTCTLHTPGLDLTIPIGALPAPTYISIDEKPPSGTPGACGFALENTRNQVATCIQLEPSGTQFTMPVTATFRWTNPPTAACNVSAVTPTGATTTVKEGTLSVYTQGTCVASHCDTTGTACATDADCATALTDPCGKAGYTTSCPVCPGTGCPGKTTLDYPSCTSPCTTANMPASCDPGADTWTMQLTHFSPYALGALAPPPDPFQCYRAVVINTTVGTTGVTLIDHFAGVTTTVRQPRSLCAPTNANGANPEAPAHADYLQSYSLRDARARALFVPYAPRRNQQVLDQFGTHKLDLTSPDRLLVPTAENLSSPPDPLASTFVDHFTCYNVKASRGSSRFQPVDVTVTDAFALAPQRIKVQRPSRLCVPTDKNGEAIGAENNPWQLLCYHATRTFKQIGGVQTANELGSSSVYPWAREEFCVPARIQ